MEYRSKKQNEKHSFIPREKQARKIIKILEDYRGSSLHDMKCLDLGCSTGEISRVIKEQFSQVVGIDIDCRAVLEAHRSRGEKKVSFVIADGARTPFKDGAFDILICAQVYEHTQDQEGLASEMFRLLRKGGICFFSGPNQWGIMEEHYWLPFLSLLPKALANIYMRLFGRGKYYDVSPLNYWKLRHLLKEFKLHDYTVQLIKQPERFELGKEGTLLKLLRGLPLWILNLCLPLMPNFNWILVKEK